MESGKFKERDFDKVEIGKSYRKNFTGKTVKITSYNGKYFIGDDGLHYTALGRYAHSSSVNKKSNIEYKIGNLVVLLDY